LIVSFRPSDNDSNFFSSKSFKLKINKSLTGSGKPALTIKLGTGVIESYFDQVYLPEWPEYVRNIDKALIDAFGNQLWLSEKSFAHELGYGGKIDLSAPNLVVDFKTKETDLAKVEPYHEHEMQLAAYCVGLGYKLEECRAAIVFVNGTTNEVKLCEIPPDSLKSAWESGGISHNFTSFVVPLTKDRGKIRSKTYPGIAKAISVQWFQGCL